VKAVATLLAVVLLGAGGAQAARAVAPTNTAAPTIAGTAQLGLTLTAASGTWSGTTPITFGYQWQRCNASGGACAAVSGGTGQTWTLGSADVDRTLRVTVTAANADGQASATSAQTAVVQRTPAPVNTAKPVVSGTPRQGETLTASTGTWSGNPTGYDWRWLRCDENGNGCTNITRGQTYVVAARDVGSRLRVDVTASNTAGSTTVRADATPTIATAAPVSTALPAVSGTAREGETLTTGSGTWSGTVASYAYRWLRCDAAGNGCSRVGSGTTYKLVAADVGKTARAEVTATNSFGSSRATSLQTPVVAASGAAPASTVRPTVAGTLRVGETLSANGGTWSGSQPIALKYEWLRCEAAGRNCVSAGSAVSYLLTASDAGHVLQVRVTASNAFGSTRADSEVTAAVTTGTASPPPPPAPVTRTVAITNVALPNQLVIAQTMFDPLVLRSRAPFTARFQVVDAQGRPVSGALVYVAGVPFGRVRPAPETATGPDGWAALTIVPTTRLPLVKGGSLVFFVRARKPGENPLAGVSARRLVQVRVAPLR
jgi:hypothetical protein